MGNTCNTSNEKSKSRETEQNDTGSAGIPMRGSLYVNHPSATNVNAKEESVPHSAPKLDEDGYLLPSEVLKRRLTEKGIIASDTLPRNFAACTQKGYYPNQNKENQDSYSINLDFANMGNDSCLFAVYDGHGPIGELFANYAKQKLPLFISKHMNAERIKLNKASPYPTQLPPINEEMFKIASKKAHIECNKKMIQAHTQNDALYSGTTAASVYIHDGKIFVSNVGDSRVILGHRDTEDSVMNKHSIAAMPISRDQTPHRRDERERIRKAGGVILTVSQVQGITPIKSTDSQNGFYDDNPGEDGFMDTQGDPPRVWCKGKGAPGTSFTRSLGDALAQRVGVYAEPEVYVKEISEDDKILIIATDGVFEFLSNQAVMDICVKSASPWDACEAIVQSAYEQWLIFDDRTDDITVIVVYLDDSLSQGNNEGK